jgi:hypothetical protein
MLKDMLLLLWTAGDQVVTEELIDTLQSKMEQQLKKTTDIRKYNNVRFKVLKTLLLKIQVYWDTMLCFGVSYRYLNHETWKQRGGTLFFSSNIDASWVGWLTRRFCHFTLWKDWVPAIEGWVGSVTGLDKNLAPPGFRTTNRPTCSQSFTNYTIAVRYNNNNNNNNVARIIKVVIFGLYLLKIELVKRDSW